MDPTVSVGVESVLLTCTGCNLTVIQSPGTRRTMCPHCGHYFSDVAKANLHKNVSQRSRSKEHNEEKLPTIRRQAPTGRFQTIAKFFQNLGGGSRASSGEPSSARLMGSGSSNGGGGTLHLPSISQQQPTKHRRLSNGPPTRRSVDGASGTHTTHSLPRDNGGAEKDTAESEDIIPMANFTLEQLRAYMDEAKVNGDWGTVQALFTQAFSSFKQMNALFKRGREDASGTIEDAAVKWDVVQAVYAIITQVPPDVQKAILKSMISSLLSDKRLSDVSRGQQNPDILRCYLILLLNPLFEYATSFVIYAYMLRQVASLSDLDNHFLVHWLRRLPIEHFRSILKLLQNFISIRLFPPKPQELPSISKCSWWIPSATHVMALLYAANNMSNQKPLLPFSDFYNSSLDHLDLMTEYSQWLNQHGNKSGFSFCQFPFILSVSAKKMILQRDSEQQMIVMARRSLVARVQQRRVPDIGMLFLNLNVRRSHIVQDSLSELARKQHDLKKKIKVTFVGEPGLDMGGLAKEWFMLLIRKIFQSGYGMFTYDKKSQCYWFSTTQSENCQEYHLIGILMGLAVYNSVILELRFPPICYRKLLSPAVVPFDNPQAAVGITASSLEDFKQVFPDVAQGLKELLVYEGDVETDFGLTFQITCDEFGTSKTYPLKVNGENISVTKENREEYVQSYVDFMLNRAIYRKFHAFYHGFHSVCASNALIMLRPEEVESLVCGLPTLNLTELQKVVTYDGYSKDDPIIKAFWDVVLNMSLTNQKRLLLFTTGSDRIPIGGMNEMTFKITRGADPEMLPVSHTCFNQLVLPPYDSKRLLKHKLMISLENAEGFGLE